MIGDSNISWVEEFYAKALGYALDDYTSIVRGKTINYSPARIEAVFGFRAAEYCWASQQRARAH
ncbi:hypothetical protein A2U01_0115458, partial [Trifolium medium]|nr:hypothetical protein [Trifolium medium]